jgi:DNA-binding LacI/PurR family transcriptional regulator
VEKSIKMAVKKKITAKDVAEYAGVSRSLVSMYLTGNSNVWISDEKKKRIDDGVKALKYTPNVIAQALRKGKTKTLGLVMGGISDRFSGCFGEAIMEEVERQGYRLFIALTRFDVKRERAALVNMLDHQVDGVIYTLSTSYNQDFFLQYENSDCPIMLTEDIPSMNFNCVCYDNSDALKDALRHLNKKGADKIAFLLSPYNDPLSEKAESIAASLSIPLDIIKWNYYGDDPPKLSAKLKKKQYDAVISMNSNPEILFREDYSPMLVSCYSLPLHFKPYATGMISFPFRAWIEMIVKKLIHAVENPDKPPAKTTLPCAFMTKEQMAAYRDEQIKDPYYKTFK